MKKKTSKLLSLTLSLALCLSLVPTVAFAAEQSTEGPVEVTETETPTEVPNVAPQPAPEEDTEEQVPPTPPIEVPDEAGETDTAQQLSVNDVYNGDCGQTATATQQEGYINITVTGTAKPQKSGSGAGTSGDTGVVAYWAGWGLKLPQGAGHETLKIWTGSSLEDVTTQSKTTQGKSITIDDKDGEECWCDDHSLNDKWAKGDHWYCYELLSCDGQVMRSKTYFKVNMDAVTLDPAPAAQIGGTSYETLAAAVKAATDSQTITLLKDVTTGKTVIQQPKDFTVDFADHTVTCTEDYMIQVKGGKVTLRNGTILPIEDKYGVSVKMTQTEEGSSLELVLDGMTIDTKTTPKGSDGVIVDPGNVQDQKYTSAKITVQNSQLYGKSGALYVNGLVTKNMVTDGLTIHVKDSTLVSDGYGIYQAGYANTTIENSTVQGETGIEVRSGNLTVESGTITGTAQETTIDPNGNGSSVIGAGIAVVQHSSKQPINVTVKDGTVTGATGVVQANPQGNDETAAKQVSTTIAGGKIIGSKGTAVSKENGSSATQLTVTGGQFVGKMKDNNTTGNKDMIESNSPVADVTNSNGNVTAVGKASIASAAKQKGVTQITVTQGDVTLENISADVAVKNSGSGKVTVNGTDIPKSDVASYSVTVDIVGNGTASVNKPFAKAGDIVAIKANPNTGYHFAGVTVTNTRDNSEISVSDYSFTMPAGHVKVVVTFQANGSSGGGSGLGGGSISTPSYSVSAERTTNGTVSITPVKASKGDTVTLTVIPDKGYELDFIQAMDQDGKAVQLTDKGNGKFTFTMPSGKVSVKAAFRVQQQSWVNPFYDVDSNAYYYDAVAWAAQKGITGGTSATTFSPNAACTRAQIVTFLWRAAGSPAPHGSQTAFADVPADSYYAAAVLWAVENGITSGTSDTTFSPNATCTRAQAVTFLHRSQNAPAVGSGTAFGDVAADAYYASAVSWAAQNGITGGTGANTFSPDASCTRAQIVTFLYRTFVK